MSDIQVYQREGFATSLVNNLFPALRKQHPKQFASDVQFIFDWESSVSGGTKNDPLNMRTTGDYATPTAARNAAASFIRAHASLDKALSKGDYGAAKKALPSDIPVPTKSKLPSPINTDTGQFAQTGVPSLLDELGGTVEGMPAQAGKDASGIGSLIGNHLVLVVLVVALILVMKK